MGEQRRVVVLLLEGDGHVVDQMGRGVAVLLDVVLVLVVGVHVRVRLGVGVGVGLRLGVGVGGVGLRLDVVGLCVGGADILGRRVHHLGQVEVEQLALVGVNDTHGEEVAGQGLVICAVCAKDLQKGQPSHVVVAQGRSQHVTATLEARVPRQRGQADVVPDLLSGEGLLDGLRVSLNSLGVFVGRSGQGGIVNIPVAFEGCDSVGGTWPAV